MTYHLRFDTGIAEEFKATTNERAVAKAEKLIPQSELLKSSRKVKLMQVCRNTYFLIKEWEASEIKSLIENN